MKRKPSNPAVESTERAIGALLDQLEHQTGDEVVEISLEDMVDTDPASGQPVVEKAVDIQTRERPVKRWSK